MDINKIKAKVEKRVANLSGSETISKYAVLLPLIEKDDDIHILFEVRALTLRRQPGEICFPGGKMDKADENELVTAIRETTEELGIPKESISIIAPLDYIVSPFGTIIYPFLGKIATPELINPNPSEVERLFTVPIQHFVTHQPDCFKVHFHAIPEEKFPYQLIHGGEKYKWQPRHINEYFYYYEDYVIWGLTASIIQQFIHLIQE